MKRLKCYSFFEKSGLAPSAVRFVLLCWRERSFDAWASNTRLSVTDDPRSYLGAEGAD